MARKLVVEIIGDASSLQKSYATAARSTKVFSRDIEHATRGVVAGTGALRGFGRSLAFASGGFLAFQGVSSFLTDSVNAAREAGVAQRSLAAQMKASGESFAANREQIERVALSYGKFGFQNDEVIAGLTVLERGTGKVSSSLKLLQLSADIARAKGIGLAAGAQVIAKVFGGQETALRRAVPGLAKNAHGWDLIRLAQAKMAGQAAANTTTAEQFAATLHNTEEIVGTGLLPTLNKYLASLSSWLQKMNESGRLQRDVAQATKILSAAFNVIKNIVGLVSMAFGSLKTIVGGTENAVYALIAAFAAFKIVGLVGGLESVAAAIAGIGTAAEGSAAGVGILETAVIGPGGLAVGLAAVGVAALAMQKSLQEAFTKAGETATRGLTTGTPQEAHVVQAISKKIARMLAKGMTPKAIEASLKVLLGGSPLADQIIGEAFALERGDPKLTARVRKQMQHVVKAASDGLNDAVKRTPEQRNTFFDQMIGRRLGRVQYEPLRQQLAALGNIATLITRRIAKTKDITRKLMLEDELLQVLAQRKDVRAQLAQQATDALALNIQKAGLTTTMSDDIAALNAVIANLDQRIALEKDIGKRLDLESQLIGYQQQRIDARRQAAEQAKAAREAARAALEAAQFRGLGLGPGGEDLPPSLAALKKELTKVREGVKGTILDTRANRGMFGRIASELAGHFGKLTDTVKAKVKEMLDNIDQQLGDHARDRTRFSHINAANFVASLGLNLTPEQARRLQVRISQVGAGGTVPGGRTPAFAGVTVNGDVHVHGVQDTKGIERELHRRAKARASTRRGAQ